MPLRLYRRLYPSGDTENPEQKAALVGQMVQFRVGKNLDVRGQKTGGSQEHG